MKTENSGMTLYIEEYFQKKQLAKLGYTFNGDELDLDKVQAFTIISQEIQRFEEDESRKLKNKGARRGKH